MKNIEEIVGKKGQENGPAGREKKIEGVIGLHGRTREEIAKWNQMTALRLQTGGRHQTSPASLWGLMIAALLLPSNRCPSKDQWF